MKSKSHTYEPDMPALIAADSDGIYVGALAGCPCLMTPSRAAASTQTTPAGVRKLLSSGGLRGWDGARWVISKLCLPRYLNGAPGSEGEADRGAAMRQAVRPRRGAGEEPPGGRGRTLGRPATSSRPASPRSIRAFSGGRGSRRPQGQGKGFRGRAEREARGAPVPDEDAFAVAGPDTGATPLGARLERRIELRGLGSISKRALASEKHFAAHVELTIGDAAPRLLTPEDVEGRTKSSSSRRTASSTAMPLARLKSG